MKSEILEGGKYTIKKGGGGDPGGVSGGSDDGRGGGGGRTVNSFFTESKLFVILQNS